MASPPAFHSTAAFAPTAAFTQPWIDLFCDFRRPRNLWLAELARATDRYLRSPAFLELMQHNSHRRFFHGDRIFRFF
jgi:hypothetical protein